MPADTLPKLEPCPFCGKEAERVKRMSAGMPQFGISCLNCGGSMLNYTKAEDVTLAWNNRSDHKIRDAKAEAWEEAALIVRTSRTYNDLKVNLSMREVCIFFVEQFMARAKAIRGGE